MGRKIYYYFNVIMTGNINSQRKLREKKSMICFTEKTKFTNTKSFFFGSFATISRRNHATKIRTKVCSFEEKNQIHHVEPIY